MTTSRPTCPCPTCQKPIAWSSENPFRPFCSERCKLIDLGEWASESHRIPGPDMNDPADFGDPDQWPEGDSERLH